jgi:hypothetical protein
VILSPLRLRIMRAAGWLVLLAIPASCWSEPVALAILVACAATVYVAARPLFRPPGGP